MKLTWIAILAFTYTSALFSETICKDSVVASEFSSCIGEVTNRETQNIESLSIQIENRKTYPLRCEIYVDSYQAKMNLSGIDDCINDLAGTSRIRQKARLDITIPKGSTYKDEAVTTGKVKADPEYYYCPSSLATNISCTRGCAEGQVEKNGECVAGDCYDPTQDVLLSEGGSKTKIISTPVGDNRCSITNVKFSCSNKQMGSIVVNSDTGVLVEGQCTAGCYDHNDVYHALNTQFPENFNEFLSDQTCSVVAQTSFCRGGYSQATPNSNRTPGFTYGKECRTACEVDGRRLKIGEIIEGTWSTPRLPTCESVRIDTVCGDRYTLSYKRNSKIVRSGGAGGPEPSRCGGSDL